MTDNVESLAAKRAIKTGDNRQWSLVECLQDVINDIQSGKETANKILILKVEVGDNKFMVGYNASNILCSEMLAAMEIAKAQVFEEMKVTGD